MRQWIITLACLGAVGLIAAAIDRSRVATAECAARDLKLAMLIEERGEAQDVAPDRLANAFRTMIRARQACHDGRVADALALYDGALPVPLWARSGPMTPAGGWRQAGQAYQPVGLAAVTTDAPGR